MLQRIECVVQCTRMTAGCIELAKAPNNQETGIIKGDSVGAASTALEMIEEVLW